MLTHCLQIDKDLGLLWPPKRPDRCIDINLYIYGYEKEDF